MKGEKLFHDVKTMKVHIFKRITKATGIPVAAQSKACVFGRSLGITGSNPAGGSSVKSVQIVMFS
jgi:hypothetical protein